MREHKDRKPLRAAFFGDYPHELAGASKSLLAAVVDARDRALCKPIIVLPAEGIVSEAFREAGLDVRVLAAPPAYGSFGKALLRLSMAEQARIFLSEVVSYSRSLARFLVQERAEVVHFNTARGILLAGLGATFARLPSVLHVRGTPRFDRRFWVAAQAMSHRIILVAHALEAELLPRVRPRARVVYNGIAESARAVPREQARAELVRTGLVPREAFGTGAVFTSLSSLTPFKGLHHLVHAAASLRGAETKPTFLLAGSGLPGAYRDWLERQVLELGVGDRVFFLGFVRDTDLLLAASDALILPSVEHERLQAGDVVLDVNGNEGLPRSILEAMRAGIPSIASDVAGVREQIDDGVSGVLIPPGDVPALAAAIERLAHDPAMRARMGDDARRRCGERFPIERASTGLVEVLLEAREAASILGTAEQVLTTFLH